MSRSKGAILSTLTVWSLLTACGAALFASRKQDNFGLVCETKSNPGEIAIKKFRSEKTGLHVILAEIEGPLVQGFFAIPTEASSDDGLPHTLEHLVFLGSEDYPYKGVLDLLANRCLAEGTNAWTAVDHTAYTVKTAGAEGFLSLLPIYVDHLLYPTFTDWSFITEVYHVTGKGEDAGVVFSEMQARENTGSELTFTALVRTIYPHPSGYRFETGGIMDNLRNLTNQKIRDYHQHMYRPENLYLIVAGQIEAPEVFRALEEMELKIMSKGNRGPFQKPWQSPLPPLLKSEDFEVVYPSSAEDNGIVLAGWRGPSTVTNVTEYQSMEVLLNYLTSTSVSLLPKTFVEAVDPLASVVYGYMLEYSVSCCVIGFAGVPTSKIQEVSPLLTKTLTNIADGTVPINMELMKNTLHNLILKQESILESSPHQSFAEQIIQELMYGNGCEYLDKLISMKLWYETLLTKPESYWQELVNRYFISSPSVIVRGIPSMAESQRLQEEEKNRVEQRVSNLGKEGLKELKDKIEQARAANDIPPPDAMLQSVPVPSMESIRFHTIKVYTNVQDHSSGLIPKSDPSLFNLDAVPVKIQLDDINSNFVQIIAVMDTSSLTPHERLYLPLLNQLLLESPLLVNGSEMSHDEVISNLDRDTSVANTISGLQLTSSTFAFGSYFHNVGINLKMEPAKYEKGVEWLSNFLFRVLFKVDRISVKTKKLINSIGDEKRSGSTVLSTIFDDAVYGSDTNKNMANVVRQGVFLKTIVDALNTTPNSVVENITKVYEKITKLDNICIHMAANISNLAQKVNITKPWTNFTVSDSRATNFSLNIIQDWEEVVPFDRNQGSPGTIFGMGSLESSFVYQVVPAITNYSHPELPALLTAISYLTQMEGPMWKRVRGSGFSYTYQMTMTTSAGLLTLQLRKSAQPVDGYKEARDIINSYINGTEKWNKILFESAKSSLVYEMVNKESDISDLVQQSLYNYYRKVPHDFNRSILKAIEMVKLEDLDVVAQKYFKPLLMPDLAKTGIVCPQSKVNEIKTEFLRMGYNLEEISSLENSRLASIQI